MKDRITQNTGIHNIALIMISLICVGAVVESISQGWEFWVPPLVIICLIMSWVIHVIQYGQSTFRENFYMIFSMVVFFYHGVHRTGVFDVVLISSFLMILAMLFGRRVFLLLLLVESCAVMFLQIILIARADGVELPFSDIRRAILYVLIELCICKALDTMIQTSRRYQDEIVLRDREKEEDKLDMEDFLVNISHELRTPVNVISGMSELILKKEDREDVASIRYAGARLALQIEDIQDYSEIQRGDVHLEEDKYMIVSLLNDVITDYNVHVERPELDLVVDLDPNVPSVMLGDVKKIGKIIRHLLSNAVKFTRCGGIYVRISAIRREHGVNLTIEMTDTGVGMTGKVIENVSKGLYQANRGRNRSTGGIGLGLPIVYGFVRKMNGFVAIDSEKDHGTTVRVSIAQEVMDPAPCLRVETDRFTNVVFHVIPDASGVEEVREFKKYMATNLASGLRINLYSAPSMREFRRLLDQTYITDVFMGPDEYRADPAFFDSLALNGVTVVVSADEGFALTEGSAVILMPKPLYGYPVVRILNGDSEAVQLSGNRSSHRPVLDGVRALVVDDEPMNLVVASGLFREYGMFIDTAQSGAEAIDMFSENDYDVVFMDHMMPEMDGVEAMKRLRDISANKNKVVRMIALTANAVSGAREMFLSEGFDGFISKPITINDFEHLMNRVMPSASFEGKEARDVH